MLYFDASGACALRSASPNPKSSRPTLGLVNGNDNLVGGVGEPLGIVQSGVPARGWEAPLAEHLNEAGEHYKPVEARASSSAIRLQRENSSVDRAKR